MKDITFSVVIPTYHRNDLLAKCLSCLKPGVQTLAFDSYEVIVSDDGRHSTAHDMILNEFPWVRWVSGPKSGPAANRNHGAKFAQGKYLVFTDDDCLPCANWLTAYSEALSSHASVYEGKTICKIGLHSPLEHAPVNETGGYLWSCNMLVNKNTFFEIGGFDEAFPSPAMEDVDFRERLKDSGYMFPFVKDAIVDHPPRRLISGFKLGATWESTFYFCIKNHKYQGDIRWHIINMLLNQKIRLVAKKPLCRDTPAFLLSTILEVLYVICHLKVWGRKYRQA